MTKLSGSAHGFYCYFISATTLPPTTPTPKPHAASSETPSVQPSTGAIVTPTAVPQACVDGWSNWINRDTPPSGGREVEGWNSTEKAAFCIGGKINSIECVTTNGIPHYSSGEVSLLVIHRGSYISALLVADIEDLP